VRKKERKQAFLHTNVEQYDTFFHAIKEQKETEIKDKVNPR